MHQDHPQAGNNEPDAGAAARLDLVISIGTLDVYEVIERCLRSLYEENLANFRYEVWIVYNGSGAHGVCERIRREFPAARLLEREGPIGYCAPHNLVLRQAAARYVLVLDDDTVVPRGTLPKMIDFMDAEPQVGMAGCKTLHADGSLQRSFALHPSLRTEFAGIFGASSPTPARLYRDVASTRDVDWVSGSFMLVRAEALEAVGGFDERYYTYMSESDWCYRIRLASWRVVYVPGAEIIHVGGDHSNRTSRTDAKTYSRIVHLHVNRFYFFWKHHGRLQSLALRPIIAMQSLTRILFFSVAYLLRPELAPIAATRVRAFSRIFLLCFSARPHQLPNDISRN